MNQIQQLYQGLKKKYGKLQRPEGPSFSLRQFMAQKPLHRFIVQQWGLWCRASKTLPEREEVVIGAILTQRTNWHNVGLAVQRLKQVNCCSLEKIHRVSRNNPERLADLIKPSGFYKQKAGYLLGVAEFILQKGGLAKLKAVPLGKLRQEILALKGVGQETGDSILLYALDKPVFVIDEYTRRLLKRKGITDKTDYAFLQKLFQDNLPKNHRLYQDFHALIVIDGKNNRI